MRQNMQTALDLLMRQQAAGVQLGHDAIQAQLFLQLSQAFPQAGWGAKRHFGVEISS